MQVHNKTCTHYCSRNRETVMGGILGLVQRLIISVRIRLLNVCMYMYIYIYIISKTCRFALISFPEVKPSFREIYHSPLPGATVEE